MDIYLTKLQFFKPLYFDPLLYPPLSSKHLLEVYPVKYFLLKWALDGDQEDDIIEYLVSKFYNHSYTLEYKVGEIYKTVDGFDCRNKFPNFVSEFYRYRFQSIKEEEYDKEYKRLDAIQILREEIRSIIGFCARVGILFLEEDLMRFDIYCLSDFAKGKNCKEFVDKLFDEYDNVSCDRDAHQYDYDFCPFVREVNRTVEECRAISYFYERYAKLLESK